MFVSAKVSFSFYCWELNCYLSYLIVDSVDDWFCIPCDLISNNWSFNCPISLYLASISFNSASLLSIISELISSICTIVDFNRSFSLTSCCCSSLSWKINFSSLSFSTKLSSCNMVCLYFSYWIYCYNWCYLSFDNFFIFYNYFLYTYNCYYKFEMVDLYFVIS